ncbi:MAG: DUF2867 domain-containing protein [Bordetella sp.]|nr:DUF2867 domain-containing protein [Bordetella sp.]
MAAARELPLDLPHAALPQADWADRFGVEGVAGPLTARQAMERMMTGAPAWVDRLMALRNRLVRLAGLKTAGIDGFPVLAEQEDEIVVGFDDRHLDFRLVIRVEPSPGHAGRGVSIATLVDRHNLLGRAYIAAVTPFHRLIVTRMLGALSS